MNRKPKRKLEKFEAMLDLQKKVSNCWESPGEQRLKNGDES